MTNNQAPIVANLDDIDREFAARAFRNTSFDPEKRGESRRQGYVDGVNGLYAEMWPLAKTAEQKEILAAEMERYRQGYLARIKAYLASHANVASAMITGPAGFPAASNQKRSQWADNKASELCDWKEKARAAIKRKLMDSRSEEEKAAAEWDRVKRDVISSITSGNTLIYASLSNRLERMANNGEVALVRNALATIRQYNATAARPVFTARHKVWTFESVAEKAASSREQATATEPETIAQGEGVRIVANWPADRVQIIFDVKPPREMTAKLKGEAWKWSPREGAWQRKLTEAAKHSAKRVTGVA